jgi:branched-chain amino acid transport system permease protein
VSLNVQMFLLFAAVYVLLTWALYINVKGGRLSNSPVYILALCSYVAAYTARELHWEYWLIAIVTILIGGLVGLLTALGFAKTRGFTLSVATIAVIFIVQNVIRQIPALGGTQGFRGIPAVDNLLIIAALLVLIVGIIVFRIDHSRFGRAAEVMRVHFDTAGAVGGVYPRRMGIYLEIISGVITGAAGAIYPFITNGIYPWTFGFAVLLYMWTILFIGGSYTMWGTIVFAPLLWGFNQIIPQALIDYVDFFFGGLLIIVLVLRPEGVIDRRLLGNITRLFSRRNKPKELPVSSQTGP